MGGDLTVSDSAEVFAYVYTGIKLSNGNLIQTGGTINAGTVAGGYYGLSIDVDPLSTRAAGNITVSGGTLDVSWFWGGHTPIVLPVDESAGFSTPLVRMWGDD